MAKRFIDAMSLVTRLSRIVIGQKSARKVYDDILCCIAEAPEVDAVEVVRCKYCVSRKSNPSANTFVCGNERCAMKEVSEDDYCSFGERRRSYIV